MSNFILSTQALNFGKVKIGVQLQKTIQISNTGNVTITFSATSTNVNFILPISSGSIIAGQKVNFVVEYSPNNVISDAANIIFNYGSGTEALSVVGSGVAPILNVSESLSFGNAFIGKSKDMNLTLNNVSDYDLSISSIISSDTQFIVKTSTSSISPQSSATIVLSFIPQNVGTIQANLTITSDDFVNPNIVVILSGIGLQENINVNPLTYGFGNVEVNTTVTQSFSIINQSYENFIVDSFSINGDDGFSVAPSSLILTQGTTGNFIVSFTPTVQLKRQAIVTGHGTFQTSGKKLNFSVTVLGTGGVPIFVLGLKTTTIAFSDTSPGDSQSVSVPISNIGNVTLQVNIASSSGIFTTSTSKLTIAQAQSSNFIVSFSPVTEGDEVANIVLTTNDPQNASVTLNLSGKGKNVPRISVSPISLAFGNQLLSSSASKTITIKNTGKAGLTFSAKFALFATEYKISPSSGDVASNSQTEVSVTFNPGYVGQFPSSFDILSNDPSNNKVHISLSGTGTAAGLQWSEFSLDKIVPPVIQEVAGSLSNVATTVTTFLGVLKGILNIIKAFIMDFTDPVKLIVNALILLINNFTKDLQSTGLYSLWILPGDKRINPTNTPQYFKTISQTDLQKVFGNVSDYFDSVRGGSQAFVSKIIYSFDNASDTNRPQFSDDAIAGCVVLAADSGDLTKVLDVIVMIANVLKHEFVAQFDPPTNLNALGGNNEVKITCSPNDGYIPESILVMRSKISGGEIVTDAATGNIMVDQNGRVVTNYDIIGRMNTIEQLSNILKDTANPLTTTQISDQLSQFGGKISSFLSSLGETVAGRFLFEDKSVQNGQTYFYVLASALNTNDSIIGKKSGDLKKKYSGNTVIQPTVTGIIVGPYSSEVSAKASNGFGSVTYNLARCRFYRCGFDQKISEQLNSDSNGQLILKYFPISISSVSGYRMNGNNALSPLATSEYRISGKIITIINSADFVQEFVVEYFYQVPLETVSTTDSVTSKGQAIIYLKAGQPVDMSTVKITNVMEYLGNDITVASNAFTVIDPRAGIIQINFGDINKTYLYSVSYDYYATIKSKQFFRCVNEEFSKYYFDFTTCSDGTTLCPGYENRNCIYNNGTQCTISQTALSQRLILGITATTNVQNATLVPENIQFNKFWDPIACQNGIMSQRCDGYLKVDPRAGYNGSPPNWDKLGLNLLQLFPAINDVIDQLLIFLNSLKSGTDKNADAIINFINLIQTKIDNLNNFIAKIQVVLNILKNDFSGPGFYLLNVQPKIGGTQYLKQSIQFAENGPNSDGTGFTAGVVLAYGAPAGGESIDAIKNAMNLLFGLSA